ncbi:hypothetical protein ACFV30_35645 [Streptomyces sp. NPDC059752]|uniref:hypothetical protein n=1 Tax=unclassified Streptomyces TaxID=2593676 RepID=UPI003668D4C5
MLVDGTDAARMNPAGKSDPALFLEAVRRPRVDPVDAVRHLGTYAVKQHVAAAEPVRYREGRTAPSGTRWSQAE